MEGDMSGVYDGTIETLSAIIAAVAGEEARESVMAGREHITDASSPAEVALWLKGAMERLDALVPDAERMRIMEACGRGCSRANPADAARAREQREAAASEEAYIAQELAGSYPSTRLERVEGVLYRVYSPRLWPTDPPIRCYCGLAQGLPAGETMSLTYCHCSRAFVRTVWEAALGRTVDVDLLSSAISGADECRFRIRPSEPAG
jgi:hypothetical protein